MYITVLNLKSKALKHFAFSTVQCAKRKMDWEKCYGSAYHSMNSLPETMQLESILKGARELSSVLPTATQ